MRHIHIFGTSLEIHTCNLKHLVTTTNVSWGEIHVYGTEFEENDILYCNDWPASEKQNQQQEDSAVLALAAGKGFEQFCY